MRKRVSGRHRDFVQSPEVGRFELLTSEEILAETERVLHYEHIQRRYHLTEEDIQGFIAHLRAVAEVVQVESKRESG